MLLAPLTFTFGVTICSHSSRLLQVGAVAALVIFAAAPLRTKAPAVARWGCTAGTTGGLVAVLLGAPSRPLLGLAVSLGAAWVIHWLWRPETTAQKSEDNASIWTAGFLALTCFVASLAPTPWNALASASSGFAIAIALMQRLRDPSWVFSRWRDAVEAICYIFAFVAAALVGLHQAPAGTLAVACVLVLGAEVARPRTQQSRTRSSADLLIDHPARLLVFTFIGLCGAGTIALALPWCAAARTSIGPLNAAFTSVSAGCVTGLTVVDTRTAFTPLGQAVVLALIQAGGLGIMTISTSALSLLGRRLSLRQEAVMAALVSQENRADLYLALRRTLAVTVVFESIGAAVLAIAFRLDGATWESAAWKGTFTSISAFNNAGFALDSSSLIPYQSNPLVLHAVALLIIAGGLSPIAILAVPAWFRGTRPSLQVRVALVTTTALLITGFVFIGAVEWNASLASMGWLDRIHNAWFQSVTLRTAGFNSVDFAALRPASWTVFMLFMFIGGSPGGTAGGLKTTTFFVLLLAVVGSLRGRTSADAFGRTIPPDTIFKATAALTMGIATVTLAHVVLLITTSLPSHIALFEVVSALGTVGLTLGGTAMLDEVGKVVIMICMFLGRVGPLTVFLILSGRRADPPWELPEESVEVG